MPAAALPPDETARLGALHAHRLLDTPAEPDIDDLTRQAMAVCAAPIGLVSLVDARRQWFKSRFGISDHETPRDQSVCAHALLTPDQPLVVPDLTLDARFADNPAVVREPKMRFYAGIPLRSTEGHALGTLCVIDHVPRQLSGPQLDALRAIAQQVSIRLSLRHGVPTERWLALGFGLGLALLLGMACWFSFQAAQFLSSDQWVTHTNQVIRCIEQTLFEVQAAESSQRGFTAAGQEAYLPPFRAALSRLPPNLAAVREATRDNPIQQRRCNELQTAIDAKLAIMEKRFDERRRLGEAALDPRYLDGSGRRSMSVITRLGQEMIELETRLLNQRAAARTAGLHRAIGVLLGTSVLGAGLLGAGFLLTRRELRRTHALGGSLAHANMGLANEVAERRRAQGRLGVQHAVARAAAENVSLAGGAPQFLRGICEHLDWELGELWTLDPAAQVMRLAHRWHRPEAARAAAFADASERWSFAEGQGLPGRVWRTGEAAWEDDLTTGDGFLRTDAAQRAGLRRAFAFPLRAGHEDSVTSVMLFLGREPGAPDPELVATMDTLAGQIAQFTERCRAEAGLRASQARFTAFMENAPPVAYIKDEDGRMLYGNQTLLRRFGLRAEQWLGKTDFDFWPDAAPVFRAHDQTVLAGGKAVEVKESVTTPDGGTSHWLSYKFPLHDEFTGRQLLAGMSIDITARENAEAALRTSLREKETLLQEVHHRVKNNLQIIGSLLSMQARRTRAPAALAALRESAGRVKSIALVHEKLYGAADLECIEAADYLRTLSRNLMEGLGAERLRHAGRVALNFELETGHHLDASVAIACGLIVNEALTNCLKHGFPDGRSGEVIVALTHQDEAPDGHRLRLEVRDNGVGVPPEALTTTGAAEMARHSLGMRLVRDLSKQIGGRFELAPTDTDTGTGLSVRVAFPARTPQPGCIKT